MSVKSILVPLNEGERCFEVLETAFVVARRFGGHVQAVHVQQSSMISEPYVLANLTGALKEAVIQETGRAATATANVIKERFESACDRAEVPMLDPAAAPDKGISASFEIAEGRTADMLIERARVSDVTAITLPQLGENTVRKTPIGETLESILFGSGRPLLIVPQQGKALRCETAAVGWNETVQASRALAATIPWLREMKKVSLVISRERMARSDLVLRYLERHGIAAEVLPLNRGEQSAGEALLQRCGEINADLLVVGGNCRARPRQLLFGGVTRHLLTRTDRMTVMVQ